MNRPSILTIALLCVTILPCQGQATWKSRWKSYSNDEHIKARVFALMDKMTLHDKLGQLTQFASPGELTTGARIDPDMEQHIIRGEVGSVLNAFELPVLRRLQKEAVEKSPLGIPILFGLDVVHGHSTVFPVPLAQSCSWNMPLIQEAEHVAAVETAASGVNWNGVPSTANRWLLTDVLRNRWGFRGMVVTDYTAIPELVNHGIVADEQEAGEAALRAGVDMDMQGTVFLRFMEKSIHEGKVFEDDVNIACARVLELKFMLGLFDHPYQYMDEKYQKKTLIKPEFIATAREMARQSIVLLKNEKNLLPLDKGKSQTIALIGPYADSTTNTIGRWAGINMKAKYVSALEGIRKAVKGSNVNILINRGCNIEGCDTTLFASAIEVARKADVVVMLVGESDVMSGEAQSRTDIRLPGVQQQLVSRIAAISKPIVMVLYNGRPLDISQPASEVDAIVENWIPGANGGDALADVLFGAYNPSGHLTMSFPRNVGQIPVYYNHKNTGRPIDPAKPFERYRSNYQDSVPNSPLYHFGYGLSYTSFRISDMISSKTNVSNTDSVTITYNITNTGKRNGATVAQLYIRDLVSCPTRPVAELAGFQRVDLKAGETRRLSFTLHVHDLGIYDNNFQWQLPQGEMQVWIGQDSEDDSNKIILNIK